jgi:hypothetical protein
MAMRKAARGKRDPSAQPSLTVLPETILEGTPVEVRGENWPDAVVVLAIAGEPAKIIVVAEGFELGRGVRPGGRGSFVCRAHTDGVSTGWQPLTASTSGGKVTAQATLRVLERERPPGIAPRPVPARQRAARVASPRPGRARVNDPLEDGQAVQPDADIGLWYWRSRDLFLRRFGRLGRVPEGAREVQIASVRRARALRDRRMGFGRPAVPLTDAAAAGALADWSPDEPGRNPVVGVCNWTPVGAGPIAFGSGYAFAGRTLSIAHDPAIAGTVFIGTANGGVWKSTDYGATWAPLSDYQRSLAIGALAIDPNNRLHLLAGTGEYNDGYVGTYYGNGVLRSDDGGNTWTEVGTAAFARAEISRIVFDPSDATGQKSFLSSTVGVYASPDGGTNWSQLRAGDASDLVVLTVPGPAGSIKLIGAFQASGLWTSTRTSGTWSPWTQIASAAFPALFDRIAMAQQRSDEKVIALLFARAGSLAGLVTTSNGGGVFSPVMVRLNTNVGAGSSNAGAPLHSHGVTVPATDMTAVAAAQAYTTSSAGAPAHTHTANLSAAQMQQLAAGGALGLTTGADATGHQHTVGLSATGQSGYNLAVGVHPTDVNTLFIAELALWRTTTGGGTFDRMSILHSDLHSFSFEMGSTTNCWLSGDGGVFRSTDTGSTWVHRNRDLATLQYVSVSQHPQWETVMIGGTQDNGTHRYIGNPVWNISAGGDGGFTAINPLTPTRMYHEYVGTTFYRSDDAGVNWALKNSGITPGLSQFYAPFALDPSNPAVCYFGGYELWRSDNNGDSWAAVTSGIASYITAIAVHPSDPNTIYVGTGSGRVYRVQRTGPTWNLVDVTRTDLTAAPLPAGESIGDLAVDPAGTVWVTCAAVIWSESAGEFVNDHVYRRQLTDTSWVSRSTGLATANPVNSIVIDPGNPSRLFCGCDVGVFRTEDAGGTWTPWDEGLPNAPVFDLAIHQARRLLRAATHGRSIWERPIDSSSCPMVDLYMRDDVLDSGRVQPTPSGQPHPFTGSLVWWWQSPDIKVDAPQPTLQTTAPVSDYVAFETDIQHRTARRGRTNRFYAQVHNRGVSPATNVQVRAFFADASGGLPALPADFWSSGKPFAGTPATTSWTPIGATQTIPLLPAAEPAVLSWDWSVPVTAAEHSCLLVVTTCTEDPLVGTGIFDIGTLVTSKKQVTLKNLQVLDPVPGGIQDGTMIMELHNPAAEANAFDVVIHWGNLPPRTRIHVAWERLAPGRARRTAPKPAREDGVRILRSSRSSRVKFPARFIDASGNARHVDSAQVHELRAIDHRSTLRGVVIPAKSRRALLLQIQRRVGCPRRGFSSTSCNSSAIRSSVATPIATSVSPSPSRSRRSAG